METIKEAKQYLRQNFDKGEAVGCPCCGQLVKRYKRKLGSPQTKALILLYKLNQNSDWVHIREIVKEVNVHGDFAKMLHWKVIEQLPNDSPQKKNSGLWKITELGKQFVKGEILLPSHVYLFDSKFIGYSDTTTSVKQSLGKKFNYAELMAA